MAAAARVIGFVTEWAALASAAKSPVQSSVKKIPAATAVAGLLWGGYLQQ